MPIHNPQSFEQGEWLRDFAIGARRAFDDESVVRFLHDLSYKILNNRDARAYPDLMTFGYFCRKASITRARAALPDPGRRVGWGTVVHIAPSNIPVNFAFSMVMGMASGNSNIVRLPSRLFGQIELMVQIFDDVASQAEHENFARETAFVQTDRDSPRLNDLISKADGVIVWGGDATVQRFRALRKQPRCVEAYFPSRVSSALLSARAVLECDEGALHKLCVNFFNDTYLVDQNACSSANLIFWQGSAAENQAAQSRFWEALGLYLDAVYTLDPVARIDRSLDIMALVDVVQDSVHVARQHNNIWRLSDDRVNNQTLRFGVFREEEIDDLTEISKFLRGSEQTLAVFGVDREGVFTALKADLAGVDRIVPIGHALDIGLHWDGRDMLSLFTRKIYVG